MPLRSTLLMAGLIVAAPLSARTLPSQSVPAAGSRPDAAVTPSLPLRVGPRVKKRRGFFGPPLLAFALLGAGGAAAATQGAGSPASPQ